MLKIRPATIHDSPTVAQLIYCVAPYKFDYCLGWDGDNALVTLTDMVRQNIGIFGYRFYTILEKNGQIVGGGNFFTNHDTKRLNFDLLCWGVRYYGLKRIPKLLYRAMQVAKTQPPIPAHMLYLGSFAILPEFRGQGFAKYLLEAKINEAAEHNLALGLDVVVDNAPAIHLYQQMGFIKQSQTTIIDKNLNFPDFITMVKNN